MFVAAITAGATSMGVDVHSVGVVPTPALAFLAGEGGFAAGIMVSASHNPAEDNGLKVLDPSGQKLADDAEEDLEALVLRADELPGVPPTGIGRAVDASGLIQRYVAHRTEPRRGDPGERPPRRPRRRQRRRVPGGPARSCGRPAPASR